MRITNSCRKIMALVIAVALMLSALFVGAPSASAVGNDAPSVTVLGATIRFTKASDNNGTQSMMIGIRVDNANKASGCAIKLTSGSTSYTVATDNNNNRAYSGGENDKGSIQTTLHSKDTAENYIVYAIVVTGIKAENFTSNISIEGKVWDMSGSATPAEVTAPASRNVMGVVAALQTQYPSLDISIKNDGKIYNGDELLTAEDLINAGGSGNDPNPDGSEPSSPPVTDIELDADNLVTNGNFANGTTGWSTNYSNGISSQTVDYTHVLRVASRWNSFSGPKTTLTGTFNVGDIITYQYKIKRSKTLDNYSEHFVVKFAESSTEHESVPTSSSDGAGSAVGDADHWVTFYGTYTVQEATSSLNIIIMESGYVEYDDSHPAADYVFYLDDVQMVKTYSAPTPSPTPVPTATPSPAPNTYVVDFSDTSVVTRPSDVSLDGNSLVFNAAGSGHDLMFNLPSSEVEKRYTKVTINYVKESGTFAFKYHKQGAGNDGQNDYRWGTGDDFKLPSGSTSKTVTFESDYYPVDRLVIFDWFASGKLTINSVVFTDPLGAPTPAPTLEPGQTPVPTAEPYVVDLSDNAGENGSPTITMDNGVCNVTMASFQGIIFKDVPTDADYKYVQVTYTKSGGNVNAYPDTGNNDLNIEGIASSGEYTTITLPALSRTSRGVKFFNFGGTATMSISSIKFFKDDPS